MSDKEVASHDPNSPESKPKVSLKQRLHALAHKLLDGPTRLAVRLVRRVTDPLIAVFRRRPLASSAVTVSSFLTVIGTVYGAMWLYERAHRKLPAPPLESVLAKLDDGDREKARELAGKLFARGSQSRPELGGALYVLGSTILEDGRETKQFDEKKKLLVLASRYLEEAREYGFSPGREADGLEKLAECYYDTGRFAQVIPVLREALEAGTENRTNVLRVLSDSHFRDSNPNWPVALEVNRQYLAQTDMPEEDRHEGLLQQARILFKLGAYDECRKVLDQIPDTARTHADLIVIRGRLLMFDAERLLADAEKRQAGTNQAQAAEKYQEAIEVFKSIRGKAAAGQEAIRHAAYLLGVCLRELGDTAEAAKQFARAHSECTGTPEGLAAALAEAEMQRKLDDDDEALKAYLRALEEFGTVEEYSNMWVALDELRARLEQGHAAFFRAARYELAIELASELAPAIPESRAVQLRAISHRAWAESLQQQASTAAGNAGEELAKQARSEFRLAGRDFSKLSQLRRATTDHLDDLWDTANCYLRGRDFERAAAFIQRYLGDEPRKRRPQALVVLGETKLAAFKLSEARKPLMDCIEFYPRDPISFRARFLLSRIYIDQQQLEEAKKMLMENIDSEVLTPQSIEYRDALFELGHLLYREAGQLADKTKSPADPASPTLAEMQALEALHQAYEESLRRMSEAVRRYPRAPRTQETQYLVAETQRALTRLPRAKLAAAVLENARQVQQRQINARLEAALKDYSLLQSALLRRYEQREISEVDTQLLRNASFGRADTLFELDRYQEAIEEYAQSVTRYQHDPESLEALVRVATCQRRLGEPEEARGTLRQAQFLLQRIPAEADFKKTTRYGREDWTKYLAWLAAN